MIILASHGKLSEGMKHTVEMITGSQPNLFAFSAYCNGIESIKDSVKEKIKGVTDERIIILTDVLGGSVNTEMTELLLDFPKVQLITGMNLPLILTLLTLSEEADITDAINEGKNSLISINQLIEDSNLEDDGL